MAKSVVITGATGNVGRKLRAYMEAMGGYELRCVCLNPENEPGVVTADLAIPDERWTSLLAGADAVIHLAAIPKNQASWAEIIPPNIDSMLNVYIAAAKAGVKRVVFASSVWAVYGRRFDTGPFDPAPHAMPMNPYGVSKMVGERTGQAFHAAHGIEGVAFRLGACQRGENIPSTNAIRGDWEQACWISNRDACQGFEKAVSAPYQGFHVLNLASANQPSRWDITRTREVLGYAPQDGHKVEIPPVRRFQAMAARIGRFALPKAVEKVVDGRW